MTPNPMDYHEKMRLRAAAYRARALYPGPVGEILSIEILRWEDFGYRLGSHLLINRLVNEIMKASPNPKPSEEK